MARAENPLAEEIQNEIIAGRIVTLYVTEQRSNITASGGACAVVDASALSGYYYHWLLDGVTGEVFAGTNTDGINECNF